MFCLTKSKYKMSMDNEVILYTQVTQASGVGSSKMPRSNGVMS